MIGKALSEVSASDIQALMDNGVTEGTTLEYKVQLPGTKPEDKKEFLADVSSFANTAGGEIYFGVAEAEGVPSAIPGLTVTDMDSERQRLDQILNSGLEPRIRYEMRSISLPDSRVVLVIRLERSWIGPHRVILGGHDKFYGRTSSGKYSLDVDQLRAAFGFSQQTAERIRAFRADRIIAVANNDTPTPFVEGAKIIMHFIPFESIASPRQTNVLQFHNRAHMIPLMNGHPGMDRINLDGILALSGGERSYAYTQLFRSGIIESVEGTLLNHEHHKELQIPYVAYEEAILQHFQKCMELLELLDVQPPIAVALSLVNVRGRKMAESIMDYRRSFPIDKDHLILPEAIVDSFSAEAIPVLKPIFDLVWNATGYPSSRNFDGNGNWVKQQY